jgi:maleate cis-trans isomerase
VQTPPHDLTEEEAEAFRTDVIKLADALYDASVNARMMYGCLAVVFIIGLVFDHSNLGDFAFYVIKTILDLALVVSAIMSYVAYQHHSLCDECYWRKVLGDMYRE